MARGNRVLCVSILHVVLLWTSALANENATAGERVMNCMNPFHNQHGQSAASSESCEMKRRQQPDVTMREIISTTFPVYARIVGWVALLFFISSCCTFYFSTRLLGEEIRSGESGSGGDDWFLCEVFTGIIDTLFRPVLLQFLTVLAVAVLVAAAILFVGSLFFPFLVLPFLVTLLGSKQGCHFDRAVVACLPIPGSDDAIPVNYYVLPSYLIKWAGLLSQLPSRAPEDQIGQPSPLHDLQKTVLTFLLTISSRIVDACEKYYELLLLAWQKEFNLVLQECAENNVIKPDEKEQEPNGNLVADFSSASASSKSKLQENMNLEAIEPGQGPECLKEGQLNRMQCFQGLRQLFQQVAGISKRRGIEMKAVCTRSAINLGITIGAVGASCLCAPCLCIVGIVHATWRPVPVENHDGVGQLNDVDRTEDKVTGDEEPEKSENQTVSALWSLKRIFLDEFLDVQSDVSVMWKSWSVLPLAWSLLFFPTVVLSISSLARAVAKHKAQDFSQKDTFWLKVQMLEDIAQTLLGIAAVFLYAQEGVPQNPFILTTIVDSVLRCLAQIVAFTRKHPEEYLLAQTDQARTCLSKERRRTCLSL